MAKIQNKLADCSPKEKLNLPGYLFNLITIRKETFINFKPEVGFKVFPTKIRRIAK